MLTLAPPPVTQIKSKKPRYPDSVFKDDHNGESQWFCVWYDHAARLIKRRLGEAENREHALRLAAAACDSYQSMIHGMLVSREQMDPEMLAELSEMVAFPRAVVERHIRRLCDRIAMEEMGDFNPRAGAQPGLKIFADRTGISDREVHRILEDDERITVGCDTVDKICVKFGLIFNDFITESMEWAERTGQWSERPGSVDPWPVGYPGAAPVDEGLI